MVAVLYSVVLVSLDNIQEHLEHPFDAVGVDDVRLHEATQFVDNFPALHDDTGAAA
jgi:hypothetical protein